MGGLAVWLYFQLGYWQQDEAELFERYGGTSKMIVLDGVRFRYADEGSGPAIILLHGAFGNLNYWDDWAKVLRPNYRVVRFDVPPEGLSDSDPKGYSHERSAELIGLLADRLGIESFALSGISRGGTASVLYAAAHPDRVTQLILANTPLLNARPGAVDIPASFLRIQWASENLLNGYRPAAYWEDFFAINSVDPARIQRRWIALYRDMNNRKSGVEDLKILQGYGQNREEDRNRAAAKAVKAHVMILTTKSISLPVPEQARVVALFEYADPLVVSVDTGHFPAIELGEQTGLLVKNFVDSTNEKPAPKSHQGSDE